MNLANLKPSAPGRKMTRIGALTSALLIEALIDGATCHELAERSGMHYKTVLDYTQALRRVGAIYVYGYDTTARGIPGARIFRLGREKDARKPNPIGVRERSRRYRERCKNRNLTHLIAGTAAQHGICA